jgi:hypothetical protein
MVTFSALVSGRLSCFVYLARKSGEGVHYQEKHYVPADLGDVLLDPRDLARYRLRAGRSPHRRCGKQIGGG